MLGSVRFTVKENVKVQCTVVGRRSGDVGGLRDVGVPWWR